MPHVVLINPFEVPEGQDEAFWQSGKRQKLLWSGNQATSQHGSTGALRLTPGFALLTWQSGQALRTFKPPSTTQNLSNSEMRPPFCISRQSTR